MNHNRRRTSLNGLAFVLAQTLNDVSKPYLDRDQDPPAWVLERTFQDVCATSHLRGGPLNADELTMLAVTLVPQAIAGIRKSIETANDRLTKSMRVVNDLMVAA
jgi:hypothetical protein